jgi:putative SOS response-associated peptidase YedK
LAIRPSTREADVPERVEVATLFDLYKRPFRMAGGSRSGQKKPGKMPFYVTRKDGASMTFAGLWERWGEDNLLTCTITTTDATDGIKGPHTRMRVILPKDGIEPSLGGGDPAVDPGINAAVEIIRVSPKMNSPEYNEPDCVEPLTA